MAEKCILEAWECGLRMRSIRSETQRDREHREEHKKARSANYLGDDLPRNLRDEAVQ
jgi:hypothetical protein